MKDRPALRLPFEQTDTQAIQPKQRSQRVESAFLVYAFFTRNASGEKEYFYVGKTRRSAEVRVREHVGNSARGHVDLAIHLRELVAATRTWELAGEYEVKARGD